MNFNDDLAVTEAVLLSAGLEPRRAHELARAAALAHQALYDGTPLAAIKAEAWRYAGLPMPSVPPPTPAESSPCPPTLPDPGRAQKGPS